MPSRHRYPIHMFAMCLITFTFSGCTGVTGVSFEDESVRGVHGAAILAAVIDIDQRCRRLTANEREFAENYLYSTKADVEDVVAHRELLMTRDSPGICTNEGYIRSVNVIKEEYSQCKAKGECR